MMDLVVDGRSVLRTPDDCPHDTTVYLGSGGGVVYRVCENCGAAIVSQSGRLFLVRPAAAVHPRAA